MGARCVSDSLTPGPSDPCRLMCTGSGERFVEIPSSINGPIQRPPGGSRTAQATIFCEFPQRPDGTPPPDNVSSLFTPANNQSDPCRLPETWVQQWNGVPPPWTGQAGGRTATNPSTGAPWCPGDRVRDGVDAPFSCNYDDTLPEFDILRCPKQALATQAFVVPLADVVEARGRLFTYYSMFAERRLVGRLPDGVGGTPGFFCFSPAGGTTQANANMFTPARLTSLPGSPEDWDPGIDPFGRVYALDSGSTLTRVVGSSTTVFPITGSVAATRRDSSNEVVVTQLDLAQVGSASLSGLTISSGVAFADDLWLGSLTPNGAFSVPAHRLRALATANVSGTVYHGPLRGYGDAAGAFNGDELTFDGTLRPPGESTSYVVHLEATSTTPRPQATITSVSPVEPECQRFADGFVGAQVTAVGASSTTSGAWTLATREGDFVSTGWAYASPSSTLLGPVTLRVPLLLPSSAPNTLALHVQQGDFYAYQRRDDVRAVDTVAPTVVSTLLQAPCGWGSSLPAPEGESDPANPKKCVALLGVSTDACDNAPRAEVLAYWAFDAQWNLKYSATGGDALCIRARPEVLDASISLYHYVIQWRAVDAWHNASALRFAMFRVHAEPPTSACGAPRSIEMLADEPW